MNLLKPDKGALENLKISCGALIYDMIEKEYQRAIETANASIACDYVAKKFKGGYDMECLLHEIGNRFGELQALVSKLPDSNETRHMKRDLKSFRYWVGLAETVAGIANV